MANRYFYKNHYSLEVDVVTLFSSVVIGASGAVTSAKGGGIASVAKQATAGQYLITLSDKYAHFFDCDAKTILGTISGVSRIQILQAPATLQADIQNNKAFLIQCIDNAGAAVNPASTEIIELVIKLRISSIGRND